MLARHDQTLVRAPCAAIAITTLLCGVPALAKLPEPTKRTIPAKLKPLMRVYTDGKGHFLLAAEKKAHKRYDKLSKLRSENVYFGSAKTLYRLPIYVRSARYEQRYMISDPRRRRAALVYDPKLGPVFHCDQTVTKLQTLDKEATKRFLAKASLRDVYWRHEPHLLARTPLGQYFYVDRRARRFGKGMRRVEVKLENLKGFRLWRGRRGRMKRLKLKDVVIDAAGQVFITKRGSLHVKVRSSRYRKLVIDEVRWLPPKSKTYTTLVRVPISGTKPTWVLIYRDLGPYRSQKLGLPCDVW